MKDFFEKYARFIQRHSDDECWPWIGARFPKGYGHLRKGGKDYYPHRCAFEASNGPGSAEGLVIRHSCDNPPCCNPAHLLGGSHQDNNDDMWSRGRARPIRGERINTAKLDDADVLEMRRMAASGMPIARIRDSWPNIKHSTITKAVRGETWSHLPDAVPNPIKASIPGAFPGQGATLLTEESAREIKRRAGREKGCDLAAEFGVSQSTVSAIKHGRIWSHV